MMRFGLRAGGIVCVAVVCVTMIGLSTTSAYYLDKEGTMKLGVRAYVNARIGTEKTDKTVFRDTIQNQLIETLRAWTFPESAAGHLRQNRFFLEVEFNHDLTDLMHKNFGPLALLNDLPINIRKIAYHLKYRGEGEGIYDWGPGEFRDRGSYLELGTNPSGVFDPPSTCTLASCPQIDGTRAILHDKGSHRNRLYEAYVEATISNLFLRFGRQVLAWGETDAFRLMDNINPLDSSFGGFLISLDERRVPIDMLRASYYLGEFGDTISEATLEGYAALDDKVTYYPGAPHGSPWTLPNLGDPSGTTANYSFTPHRTFNDIRGGARLLWNAYDVTWSVAHYYTYADNPTVQSCVAPGFPTQRISSQRGGSGNIPGCPVGAMDLPLQHPSGLNPFTNPVAPLAYTIQAPAKMQISGASATFTIPSRFSRLLALSGEPVVRTELAYFKDEPAFTQASIDPFIYHFLEREQGTYLRNLNTGGILKKDSINFVVGLDLNQFFHFLNPVNSFFISTQFFYKHIKKANEDIITPTAARPTHLVLPVPAANVSPAVQPTLGSVEPILVRSQADQFLQTLLISTSYRSGTVNPSLTLFYDWSGAIVVIPAVTFVHDPFRFSLEYDILDAANLLGNSGVSLLRDRDNILFQLEYVI